MSYYVLSIIVDSKTRGGDRFKLCAWWNKFTEECSIYMLALETNASRAAHGVAKGYLPWHCYQFPMGKQDDIEDLTNIGGQHGK